MAPSPKVPETIEDIEKYPNRIDEHYQGKTLLITGGTGFTGKVLLEKLLRSCSALKKIYVLVRTKKGKDPNERLAEIFKGPLFELLRNQKGEEVFNIVEAIPADISAPDLALSKEDRQRVSEEIQIIYHCAATIRFDEHLKTAVFMNVRGTKLILELAKECKKLEALLHFSTAYCHLHERILYEKPYPPPADPYMVIRACEWLSEEALDTITDKILGDIPNTYAFTKALGEALVVEEMNNLPVIILRPSVIVPIWKDPLPGWTDNINGPTGLLIGAGKGVIRTMYCKGETYSDYLPVDVVVNGAIVLPFYYTHYKKQRIFNITSSALYKISFEEIIEIGKKIVSTEVPLNGVLWYPGGSMKRYRFIHNIDYVISQLIPAILIDTLLVILRYPPVLMRVQRRIRKGYEVFEYYANNQWDFNNEDTLKAREVLNPRETAIYTLHGNDINYHDYFKNCVLAARRYVLKETDETLPAARRHMKIMWFVDTIYKTLIVCGFFYLLWVKFLAPVLGA